MADTGDHYTELAECVRSLWAKRRLCDTTLHCEGSQFNVHSVVLAAYSKTLFAMMLDKQSNAKSINLNITGVSTVVLNVLLEYFYTGVKPALNEQILNAIRILDIPSLSELIPSKCEVLLNTGVKSEPEAYKNPENNQNGHHQSQETIKADGHEFAARIPARAEGKNDQSYLRGDQIASRPKVSLTEPHSPTTCNPDPEIQETLDTQTFGSDTTSTEDSQKRSVNNLTEQSDSPARLYKLPSKRIRCNQSTASSSYKYVEQFIACKMDNLQRNISDVSVYQCMVCKADFVFKKLAYKHVTKLHKDILRQVWDWGSGTAGHCHTPPGGSTPLESPPGDWRLSEAEDGDMDNEHVTDSDLVSDPRRLQNPPGSSAEPSVENKNARVPEPSVLGTSSDPPKTEPPKTETIDLEQKSLEQKLHAARQNKPKTFDVKQLSRQFQLHKYILTETKIMQSNHNSCCQVHVYQCAQCRAVFQFKSKVYKHILEAHPELCVMKTQTTTTQSARGKKAGQSQEIKRNADSNLLDSYIKKKETLIGHHANTSEYECTVCTDSFVHRRDASRHFMKVHPKIHRALPNSHKYLCMVCGKLFVTNGGLRNHMEVHTSDPVPCHVCRKMFKTRIVLQAHLRNIHQLGNTPSSYQCETCGESFTNIHNLRYHNQSKHEPKKHCANCGKEFSSKFGLRKHVREKHSEVTVPRDEDYEVSCPQCGKVCLRKYLSAHIRAIHRKDDPKVYKFVCEFCDMRFYKRDKLHRHRKTHEKKLPAKSYATL